MRLIVILGCNPSILDGRISVACENYKKGDKILATGTVREAVYIKTKLVNKPNNIDPESIVMDIKSKTTMDNIFINASYIKTFGTVLLVTSQSHMCRSKRLLRLVYGGKIETAYIDDSTTEYVDEQYFIDAESKFRKFLTNKKK